MTNPLPIDLNIHLTDKNLLAADFFNVQPNHILSNVVSKSVAAVPVECDLFLAKSLDTELTKLWTKIEMNIELGTSNEYLNKLLAMLNQHGIVLDITFENQNAPKIVQRIPETLNITIDEGKYTKREIGSIKAEDLDVGEQGQLEYFLFGSGLLEIDKKTGVIYITGSLDAENEQQITFFCFARDMAESSISKQSEIVTFTLSVNDINEFHPIIQIDKQFLDMSENDETIVSPSSLANINCFDNDVDAELTLEMNAIGLVEMLF